MATIKTNTPEEKRQHLHNIIMASKKHKEEAQKELEKKCETQEFKQVLKELKEANAKKGIIIPGEV